MTNEKLLAKLHEIDTDIACQSIGSEPLDNLIAAVEDEIRTETANSRGQGNAMKTAKDILKTSEKGKNDSLKYAYTAPDGFQYVLDGYRLLKLHNPLPLPELPGNILPVRYENIIPHPTNTVKLDLPDPIKLRAYIKIKASEKVKMPMYDFGIGLPVVNAKFLLSMIEALPRATVEVEPSSLDYNHKALLFYAENEDFGMLLPIRASEMKNRGKTEL